jgi:hypothetical protein
MEDVNINYKPKNRNILSKEEIKFIIDHHNIDMEAKDISLRLKMNLKQYMSMIARHFKPILKNRTNLKKCIICGKFFTAKRRTFVTCGEKECLKKHSQLIQNNWRRVKNKVHKHEKTCEICGRSFITWNSRQKRCYETCSKRPLSAYQEDIKKEIIKCSMEKQYYSNHEEVKRKRRQNYKNNIEKHRKWNADSYSRNKDKKRFYYLNNKEKINKQKKEHYQQDPSYRIRVNLKNRINAVLKGNSKSKSTMEFVGCSIEQLWIHLESKFTNGMTKENYGKWHVDHIIPCCFFDLSLIEEQKKCFNYTNLQPLWAIDNIKKGGKLLNTYETNTKN